MTILALHYWAGSGRAFDLLRPWLPPGTALLAPDLPGFGSQAAPAGFDYSVAAYADWVADFIQAHQLKDFELLGHSMGGKFALALAARRPAGLRRLTLLSPSPPAGEPIPEKSRRAALAAFGDPVAAEATYCRIAQRPLPAAQHRQAFDIAALHQTHRVLERHLLRDGAQILGHDLADLAAMRVNEVLGGAAGTEQEFEPAAALALRADFAAADEVALGDNADRLARLVQHGQPADVMLQHQLGGLDQRRLRVDRDDMAGHDLMRSHGILRERCFPKGYAKRRAAGLMQVKNGR